MLTGVRAGGRAWARSLGVLARSPDYIIALAVIGGAWALAAYEWLWLPESSGWVLALAFIWLVALAALALGLVTGTVATVSAVASDAGRHLRMRTILDFGKKRFGRSVLVVVVGIVVGIALDALFGWINSHALTIASFLTFHAQRPVSYMLIGKILWVIEALIWIAFAGLLMTWLLALSNPQQRASAASSASSGGSRPRSSVFLTGVLSAVVFGGLAWRVATWRPVVKAGGWDYAQLTIRTSAALLLLSLGWLFWTVALARLTIAPVTDSPASPPPS